MVKFAPLGVIFYMNLLNTATDELPVTSNNVDDITSTIVETSHPSTRSSTSITGKYIIIYNTSLVYINYVNIVAEETSSDDSIQIISSTTETSSDDSIQVISSTTEAQGSSSDASKTQHSIPTVVFGILVMAKLIFHKCQ